MMNSFLAKIFLIAFEFSHVWQEAMVLRAKEIIHLIGAQGIWDWAFACEFTYFRAIAPVSAK